LAGLSFAPAVVTAAKVETVAVPGIFAILDPHPRLLHEWHDDRSVEPAKIVLVAVEDEHGSA
jgi:hypothetical protein